MIKHPFPTLRHLPLLAISGLLLASTPVALQAQDQALAADSPEVLMSQGDQALQQSDFATAEAAFDLLIETFGTNAKRVYGPYFGVAYYGRGVAKLAQGRSEEAILDFQTCVEDFSNEDFEGEEGSRNPVVNLAIFQWGSALRLEEDYRGALSKFETFEAQASREEGQQVGRAQWEYEHAYCYVKIGELKEAREHIEELTTHREEYRVQFRMLADILARYTEAAIKAKDEESAIEMLAANRGITAQSPHLAFTFMPQYLSLADGAKSAGMQRLQLLLYSLIPQEQELRDSIELASSGLPANYGLSLIPRQVEAALDDQDAQGLPHDVVVLLNEAVFYENSGNDSAAFAIFRSCENYFDADDQLRPDILYGACRTSSRLGLLDLTELYGRDFLKNFPGHDYEPAVRQLLLESMFYDGKYADALRIGREVRPDVQDGTGQAEMVDYVIAGSLYFLSDFKEADGALSEWLDEYVPAGEELRQEWISFFKADNKGKLLRWSESAALLDKFLEDYPETTWLDRALFSRAQAHYYLQESEPALASIEEIFDKVPGTDLRDQILVLQGQCHLALGDLEKAQTSFEEGLALAENSENQITAGEALYNLIGLLVEDDSKDETTIGYYDKFLEEYPDNPYRPQVVSVGVPALVRGGRLDDALQDLEDTFIELGNQGDVFGLSETVAAYTDAFMGAADSTPDAQLARAGELGKHLDSLEIPLDLTTLRARIAMAKISVYQKLIDNFEDGSDAEIRATAQVQAGYRELAAKFPIEDLDSFALMSLANQLFLNGIYDQAAVYFEGAMARNDQTTLPRAILGLGQSLAQSEDSADQARAKKQFESLFANHPTETKLHGEAVYALAQLDEKRGDWEQALEQWNRYLQGSMGDKLAEATYRYALVADQELDRKEAALGMYSRVVTVYRALFPYAIPSLLRAAELTEGFRSNPQLAYEMLDLGVTRYDGSMRRGTLRQAGYDEATVNEILGAYRKIQDMHERLHDELGILDEKK